MRIRVYEKINTDLALSTLEIIFRKNLSTKNHLVDRIFDGYVDAFENCLRKKGKRREKDKMECNYVYIQDL